MVLTFLPAHPVPLRVARDWATYEKGLAATPILHRLLGGIMPRWVEGPGVANPLALPWVRILADGDLGSLEDRLQELQAAMGEENLSRLFADLLPKKGSASDVRRGVSSLFGEIVAFQSLRKAGARTLEKITQGGDWLADGWTVSVKTVMGIDHNYDHIESTVEGLAYLTECPTIRRIRSFRVAKGNGLDYELMGKIMHLLDFRLESLLQFLVQGLAWPGWYYATAELNAVRVPEVAGATEAGRLKIKGGRYDERHVIITLEDMRSGEKAGSLPRGIEFQIELRKDDGLEFSTSNDLNSWWGMPALDRDRLGVQLREKLAQIADQDVKNSTGAFAGWINIEVHPRLSAGTRAQRDSIRDYLAGLVGETSYPVVVCFFGGVELAEPMILSFGPPIQFDGGSR